MKKTRGSELQITLVKTKGITLSEITMLRKQMEVLAKIYKNNKNMLKLFQELISELDHYTEEIQDLKSEFEEKILACLEKSKKK
jgi:hypothetical protein